MLHTPWLRFSSITLVLLGITIATPMPADGKCSFAWNSLIMNDGTVHDYTTAVATQPYQGPCMAFAFVAGMESMYKLEHANPNLSPNLSEAWIDYRTWGVNQWKTLLQHNQTPVPEEACGNFPPACRDEEAQCLVNGEVSPYVDAGECFEITRILNDKTEEVEYEVTAESTNGISWYRAGFVDNSLAIPDADALKVYIQNSGPVVLRINEAENIAKFRNYDTEGVTYHAVTLIGWQDLGTCTQWLVKDSWPGMSGIAYTKPNIDIPGMLATGAAEAWQVAEISYQATDTSPITPAGTAWPNFSPGNQCVPPPDLDATLNCWDYGADKGGCLSVPSAIKGASVSWQLVGTGGYLVNDTGDCAEVIGSHFTGVLKATATDGCGRTVSRSCHFSGGPGPR